jgi:hypothetical protein
MNADLDAPKELAGGMQQRKALYQPRLPACLQVIPSVRPIPAIRLYLCACLCEKFSILTQLSSWFRHYDNPNVGFGIVGHHMWAPCYFDTIRTFSTSCTCICAV